jgi:hypothetical protein
MWIMMKVALVEKLLKPDAKTPKERDGFEASFGGWEGPDMSTEEIKAEIKANRQFRKKIPLFS